MFGIKQTWSLKIISAVSSLAADAHTHTRLGIRIMRITVFY